MKILDRYILKSFLQTLATVFVILFFIFILQGFWLFISELAGKDLDLLTIVKFLLLYSPRIVPLVLPLSVLLASIMTFGSFAENYEFAAMKSAGISLKRSLQPLSIFIGILALISFWFANNVIPKSEFEFINLRKEIIETKPAMAITEGVFSQLGNTNIKVEKKYGENGEMLKNVTIHVKSNTGVGNKTIIKAKEGKLSNSSNNILTLDLFDGYYYEDIKNVKKPNDPKQPFVKSYFKTNKINIDISLLNKQTENEDDKVVGTSMLNLSALFQEKNNLYNDLNKELESYTENTNLYVKSKFYVDPEHKNEKSDENSINNIINQYSSKDKERIYNLAINTIESNNATLFTKSNYLFEIQKSIFKHDVLINEKFVIAFSCILMFFIGAPLGAIIRKGGLGLPIVFAVLIFITYHFINTFGKKVAQEGGLDPNLGAWLSSLVLLPLAIFLTYRATNDLNVNINLDWIIDPIKKIFSKKKKQTT